VKWQIVYLFYLLLKSFLWFYDVFLNDFLKIVLEIIKNFLIANKINKQSAISQFSNISNLFIYLFNYIIIYLILVIRIWTY